MKRKAGKEPEGGSQPEKREEEVCMFQKKQAVDDLNKAREE
jgi:hypothetical protein